MTQTEKHEKVEVKKRIKTLLPKIKALKNTNGMKAIVGGNNTTYHATIASI